MAQSRTRKSPLGLVLVAAMAFGGSAALMSPSVAHAGDDNACSGKAELAPVKAACKEGGKKAVKKLMKKAVKKAKAKGNKWKCKTCHNDNGKGRDLKSDDVTKKIKDFL